MKLFAFLLYFAFYFKFYDADESFNLLNLGLGKRHFNRVWCLNGEFTCSSTKCVPDSVLCDGIHDCDDGSDENPELCRTLNPRSCKLPPITEDRSYIVNCEENVPIHSGDYVPEMSLLSFVCKQGYAKKSGNQFQSFCLNNTWIPAIQSCSRVCKKPQIPNLSFHCYQNDEQVPCPDELSHGIKIKLSCPPFHHPTHEEIVCNENGEWDVHDIKCVAECGKYYPEAEKLLNGKDYPWHVSVKRKNPSGSTYVFSGTLVSPNLVMTVARSEADTSGNKMPAKGFEVVVNNYLDAEYREVYKVKNIFFSPKGFSPQSNLADEPNDIAILLLEKSVNISSTVLPICMDWTNSHVPSETRILSGKIARFGDAKETISPVKEEIYILEADSYDYEACLDKVPASNIQDDQFCGSVTDGNETGRSDYGTGYYVENPNDHLYYMTRVYRANYASAGVKVFTNVSIHFDWLKPTYFDVEKWFDSKELSASVARNGDCDEMGNCKLEHTSFKPLYYNSLMLSCKEKKLDVLVTILNIPDAQEY